MTTHIFTDQAGDELIVDGTHWDKGRVLIMTEDGTWAEQSTSVSLSTKQMRSLASLVTELANLMEENEK